MTMEPMQQKLQTIGDLFALKKDQVSAINY